MAEKYIMKTKEVELKSNELATEEQATETVKNADILSTINSKLDLLLQAQNIQEVK